MDGAAGLVGPACRVVSPSLKKYSTTILRYMKFHDKFGSSTVLRASTPRPPRSGVTGMIAEPGVRKRSEELNELSARTRAAHLFEFWSQDFEAEHDATNPAAIPCKRSHTFGSTARSHPLLKRSGELIDMYMSERRSLIMVNPALRPNVATVSTMLLRTASICRTRRPLHIDIRRTPSGWGLPARPTLPGSRRGHHVWSRRPRTHPRHLAQSRQRGDSDAVNLSVLDMPLVNTLNSTYFDHEYTEEEAGKLADGSSRRHAFPPTIRSAFMGAVD